MKKILTHFSLWLITSALCFGAEHRNVEVTSKAMNRPIAVTVILPEGYATNKDARFPVVYALHGAGGNNLRYSDPARTLGKMADRYQTIVVVPDGSKTSWWLDSPIDPKFQYETFVMKRAHPSRRSNLSHSRPTRKTRDHWRQHGRSRRLLSWLPPQGPFWCGGQYLWRRRPPTLSEQLGH